MASRWGGAATGALSGAGIGTAIAPGIGTLIGALLGGGTGFLTSAEDKYKQLPTKSPEQLKGLSQIYQNLNQMNQPGGSFNRAQNYLSNILSGDQTAFDQFAAPYMTQFQEQIVPRLASRFAGIGGAHGGGAIGSSGFAQALGGAGSQLQSNLAGLFSNLQRGAATDVMGQYNQLSQLGLGTSPFENIYEKGSTGVGGGLASGLGEGFSKYASQKLFENGDISKVFESLIKALGGGS